VVIQQGFKFAAGASIAVRLEPSHYLHRFAAHTRNFSQKRKHPIAGALAPVFVTHSPFCFLGLRARFAGAGAGSTSTRW
jgi:hypothetical protein